MKKKILLEVSKAKPIYFGVMVLFKLNIDS